MRSREVRRDLAVLAALGLVINGLASRAVSMPGYVDAYYYFGGAVQLARGSGFTEPYVWTYLTPRDPAADAAHRWPSHLYWMPLTSIVAAPFMAVAEALARRALAMPELFRAAQLPFIVIAAALPLVSYGVARTLTGRRRHAWAAALLTLFSAYYFIYWTTTDAFALFGAAASGALWLGARAARHPGSAGRSLTLAGVAAGLAHLARADGILVLICLAGWWLARGILKRPVPATAAAPARAWLIPLLGLGLGYLLVMGPWFARNLAIVGAPIPPGAARTLWLTHYDDYFTYAPEQLTPAAYLASDWRVILDGKLAALRANFATLVGVQANVVALPFALIGVWRLRRHPLLRLAGFYGVALFVLMTLVFTFPGARGGYFHSGAALLPFLLTAAVAGLDAVVDAAARRLPHWQPERAKPVFTMLFTALPVVLAGLLYAAEVTGTGGSQPAWARRDAVYGEMGRWLESQGEAETVVAVNNPPGWYYHTGQAAIVIPAGDAETLLAAMDSVAAPWLVLDVNHPAALAGLYTAPEADARLTLAATFQDGAGRPVYLLRRSATP